MASPMPTFMAGGDSYPSKGGTNVLAGVRPSPNVAATSRLSTARFSAYRTSTLWKGGLVVLKTGLMW